MVTFVRGKDVKQQLDLGKFAKKDFANIDEIIHYILIYPEAATNNIVTSWNQDNLPFLNCKSEIKLWVLDKTTIQGVKPNTIEIDKVINRLETLGRHLYM